MRRCAVERAGVDSDVATGKHRIEISPHLFLGHRYLSAIDTIIASSTGYFTGFGNPNSFVAHPAPASAFVCPPFRLEHQGHGRQPRGYGIERTIRRLWRWMFAVVQVHSTHGGFGIPSVDPASLDPITYPGERKKSRDLVRSHELDLEKEIQLSFGFLQAKNCHAARKYVLPNARRLPLRWPELPTSPPFPQLD